ncbi:MAG: DUF4190 domain-containing protein [Verrucomicrobiae bacterium]|nr:DUF4190 domain-containing protein [Verrucomicrobiae bacterium]MDW7980290.1 DUF4190 domain-containing protein [Verrucomicrobiales bacterium]
MYRIIGADGREYGPVPETVLRQWIAEGRVNGQTRALLEGTAEWKPLSAFPAFADLAAPPPIRPPQPPAVQSFPTGASAPRTSPMALAGFICSLLGVLCCGVLSLPGLIFAIIGLVETRKRPQQFSGEGWAIAGIVLGIVGLLIGILMLLACVAGLPFCKMHGSWRWHL